MREINLSKVNIFSASSQFKKKSLSVIIMRNKEDFAEGIGVEQESGISKIEFCTSHP